MFWNPDCCFSFLKVLWSSKQASLPCVCFWAAHSEPERPFWVAACFVVALQLRVCLPLLSVFPFFSFFRLKAEDPIGFTLLLSLLPLSLQTEPPLKNLLEHECGLDTDNLSCLYLPQFYTQLSLGSLLYLRVWGLCVPCLCLAKQFSGVGGRHVYWSLWGRTVRPGVLYPSLGSAVYGRLFQLVVMASQQVEAPKACFHTGHELAFVSNCDCNEESLSSQFGTNSNSSLVWVPLMLFDLYTNCVYSQLFLCEK